MRRRERADPLNRHSEDDYVQFRLRTVNTAAWPTAFVASFCLGYYALSWDEAHRSVLVAISLATIVVTLLVPRLPLARVVEGRWREPFFVGWSASLVALVLTVCSLDGGVSSPLALAFFLPLAYAALSYPRLSLVAVTVVTLAGFLGLASLGTAGDPGFVLVFAGALLTQGWVCAWQATNHDLQHRALARLSRTDSLTGALNRRGFDERLVAELSRAQREGGHLALVLFDLDSFKLVNDTGGHEAGDELLRLVSATLEHGLRGHDAVARVGGDEFAVLLDQRREAAELTARRLRAALARHAPASAGVACYPGDGETAEDLVRHADAALYVSKARPQSKPARSRAITSA